MDPVSDMYNPPVATNSGDSFEERALAEIKEYMNKCKDQRRNTLEKQWEQNYRQWKGLYDKRDMDKPEADREMVKSEIFIKETQEKVSTAHAALVQIIFPADDWFDVSVSLDEELNPNEDDELKVEYLKETLKNLYRLDNRKKKISKFIRNACIYGTAIAQVYPKPREITQFAQMPMTDQFGTPVMGMNQAPMMTKGISTRVVKRPSWENVDIRNFYVDIYADNLDQAKGLIKRAVVSKQYLLDQAKKGVYRNVADLQETTANADRDAYRERFTSLGISTPGEEGIELWEYWGTIGEDPQEWILTIAQENTLIRKEKNDLPGERKRPFLLGVYDEDSGIIYGVGIPEKIQGSQAAINAFWRAKVDNFAQLNNVETIVNVMKLFNLEEEDFKRYPGKIWLTKESGAIDWHRPTNISNDLNELGMLHTYGQKQSGVPDLLGGIPKRGEQTATEVSALEQNTSNVMADIAQNLEQDVIIPMVQLDYTELVLWMDDYEIVKIAGETGAQAVKRITIDDIYGNYDFKALGSSHLIARTIYNSYLLQFMQIAGPDPSINRPELYKRFLENLRIKGIDKIINDMTVAQVPLPLIMEFMQASGMDPRAFLAFVEQKKAEVEGQPGQVPAEKPNMNPPSQQGSPL